MTALPVTITLLNDRGTAAHGVCSVCGLTAGFQHLDPDVVADRASTWTAAHLVSREHTAAMGGGVLEDVAESLAALNATLDGLAEYRRQVPEDQREDVEHTAELVRQAWAVTVTSLSGIRALDDLEVTSTNRAIITDHQLELARAAITRANDAVQALL